MPTLMRIKQGKQRGLLGRFWAIPHTWGVPPKTMKGKPWVERVDYDMEIPWYVSPFPNEDLMDFFAEWSGFIEIPVEGEYEFFMKCDDGCMLEVEGVTVIEAWRIQPPTLYIGDPIYLEPGPHRVRIRYFNIGPFGLISFGWLRPDGRLEILDGEHLFTRTGSTILIRGVPKNVEVELWSGNLLARGRRNELGLTYMIPPGPMPVDAYFKIKVGGEVYETQIFRDVWGGDVYEYVEGEGPIPLSEGEAVVGT